ncbi:putative skeletal organic matrix protein 5 [Acropora palmata]|uniref:putative skeletal organic matrix protein 5 n=1 Tax=Acropora palmata TaxID=6131 RepID=UPI003D9FFD6F
MPSGNVSVYCHMSSQGLGSCSGGGWTLVMKIDGRKQTFHYNSVLWSNNESFNLAGGETGFDNHETKLPTYWKTPFDKICLGMKIGQQKRFIVVHKKAISLHSLIADGQYRNTSLDRGTWMSLIGVDASLQNFCNMEGFNVVDFGSFPRRTKARIGLIANEKDNCIGCDSRIGFGTGGAPFDLNVCGNSAMWIPGKHDTTNTEAFCYILVQ